MSMIATKKAELKDDVKSRVRSRAKNPSSNEGNAEASKKSESSYPRKLQTAEHKGDGDRSKASHSSLTSRTQPTRSTSKQPVSSSQPKTIKQSLTPSTSKSSLVKASLSSHSMKMNASSKTRAENLAAKSNDDSTVKRRKSREAGYSEKRGLSTIYVPKSTTSKLNVKPNEKITSQTKGKTQDIPVSGRTKPRMSSRERRKSRTLSPSEIRMLHSAIGRPSDVDKDTKQNKGRNAQANSDETGYEYEDDFEDYESDFQECTDSEASPISERSDSSDDNSQPETIELQTREKKSVVNSTEHAKAEEERKLDSGHYDLAEARKRAARMESMVVNHSNTPPLPELKEPVGKAFSDDRPAENKSLPSSADEGFEDSRSGDFTKSPPLSQTPFIDFRKSKENSREENSRKHRSRGEELLEMIKLDFMGWSILECSPVPYDEFIRNYGKLNTQQIFTQTGDDDMDIEIQTDEVLHKNKWTQFPVTCRKGLRDSQDVNSFRLEQIGVGGDLEDPEDTSFPLRPSYDVLRLNDFLNRAGTVVLSLLEEREHGGNVFQNDTEELPFSDGFVKLSVNTVTFLAGRAVKIIHYSDVLSKVLLTVHSPVEEEIETVSKQDYITDRCIGCVWNVSEPSMPKKLFYSQCPITACCFHLTNRNVVFAGLEDGSLSLWDLKEDEMWHQKVTDKANELDWVIRTPTYTTTADAESDTHTSQIVAIRVLSKLEAAPARGRSDKFVPIQICSLDEDGCLVVWSIVHSMGVNIDDLGLSHWGDIRLVKNQKRFLSKGDAQTTNAFLDMRVDSADTNNVYVATNSTDVTHATCIGNRTNPLTYKPADISGCGNSTCIEVCPFGQSFFLVGCDDGTIRLHFLNVERPIVQLKNEQFTSGIKVLQWSRTKPSTVYVLDDMSRIHVWDLSESDVCPIHTFSVQKWGKISSMQLSSCTMEQDMANQYLAFGMESGNVEVHKLRKNFYHSRREEFLQELDIFSRYVSVT
ncbi:WD repeat-containing protein 60 isoform X2 [Harpegnathos saltator]|uniref:WD repeat-containing protein 60 isoform X2 n=1 Tax=Harpegnathos saltator TaxID=610380 RepID=UPI00058D72EB|nr:WD repeat-containing protein 60 isoform X2 [Harpegnathos saltator]